MNAYEYAKEKYNSLGIDTDAVMEILKDVPISIHCWQGDDVQGFDALSPIDRYDLAIRMIAEQVEEAKEILRDAGIKPY